MTKLFEFLKKLEAEGFYGSICLEFKAGELILVRKEQTLKLEGEGNTRNGNRY
jgi:hypothetical protein